MFFGKYPPERAWCVQCDTGKGPHQAGCPNSPKWPPEKESECPANPAPQGEQQQQEPSSDGQSRSKEPSVNLIEQVLGKEKSEKLEELVKRMERKQSAKPILHLRSANPLKASECEAIHAALDGRLQGWQLLVSHEDFSSSSHLSDASGLIEAIQAQTKAMEAHSADVREYTKATANLTIHIGLLIQAMADGQDESGDMASVRTLG